MKNSHQDKHVARDRKSDKSTSVADITTQTASEATPRRAFFQKAAVGTVGVATGAILAGKSSNGYAASERKQQFERPKLRLSPSQLQLTKEPLREIAVRQTKIDNDRNAARFKRRKAYGKTFEAEMKKAGIDLRKSAGRYQRDIRKWRKTRATEILNRTRSTNQKQLMSTVWGDTSGVIVPEYELSWEHYDVTGAPASYGYSTDKSTGELWAAAVAWDSAPKSVDSYAGLGFWYIPNQAGQLQVASSPSLHYDGLAAAGWFDVGVSHMSISMGIAKYLRNPFSFVEWSAINEDVLWSHTEDDLFDDSEQEGSTSAHNMTTTVAADTSHYYAVWVWVRSYSYGENGFGAGFSSVEADVNSFSYAFFT